jgi:hypothetical protein
VKSTCLTAATLLETSALAIGGRIPFHRNSSTTAVTPTRPRYNLAFRKMTARFGRMEIAGTVLTFLSNGIVRLRTTSSARAFDTGITTGSQQTIGKWLDFQRNIKRQNTVPLFDRSTIHNHRITHILELNRIRTKSGIRNLIQYLPLCFL